MISICLFRGFSEHFWIENCIPTDDQYTNNVPIAIDTNGKAHITDAGNEERWPCSYLCRTLNDNDVDTILNIKRCFQKPITELRQELCEIDHDCPHIHHVKPQYPDKAGDVDLYKLGHPLLCATCSCHSKLRIL